MKKIIALFILGLLCFSSIIVWDDAPKFVPFCGMAISAIALLLIHKKQSKNEAEYSPVYPILTLGDKQPPPRKNKKKRKLKKYLPILFLISAFALVFFFFVLPTFKPPRPSFIEPTIGIGILIIVILALTFKKPKES